MKYHFLTPETLANQITDWCRHHSVSPSRFGRQLAGDPNLVADLRNGSNLGLKLVHKILDALAPLDDRAPALEMETPEPGETDHEKD